MIDLLRWCMGEVTEIYAYGSKLCLTKEQPRSWTVRSRC